MESHARKKLKSNSTYMTTRERKQNYSNLQYLPEEVGVQEGVLDLPAEEGFVPEEEDFCLDLGIFSLRALPNILEGIGDCKTLISTAY